MVRWWSTFLLAVSGIAVSLGPNRKKVDARHGEFLILETDTWVGRSLELLGEFSQHEVEMLVALLRPGDTVIDVGANVGALAIPFARRVGPDGGLIVAVEAQPALAQVLGANTVLNGLQQSILTLNVALGDYRGLASVPRVIYDTPGNYGAVSLRSDEEQPIWLFDHVPMRTLDDIVDEQGMFVNLEARRSRCPRLVKIDVEGMELEVLRGAGRTLRECRPLVYVENNCVRDSPGLIMHLSSLGYELYWDVQPYYNHQHFRRDAEDALAAAEAAQQAGAAAAAADWRNATAPFLSSNSVNMLGILPQVHRVTLHNWVKVRNDLSGWWLDQYELTTRPGPGVGDAQGGAAGAIGPVRVRQAGTMKECVR